MGRAPAPLVQRCVLWAGLAVLSSGLRPVAADWLVTRQGDRIETRGPWQERGKLVVFSHSNGTLVSMRLSEVDLDSSRAATREAAAAASLASKGAPAVERKAVTFRLTDKDFQHSGEAPKPDKEGGAVAPVSGEKPRALTIGTWDRQRAEGDGHVVLQGTVRNTSSQQVTSAGVSVRLFDGTGQLLATQDALLASTVIPPGGSTRFEVDFPDLFTFGSAKFDTKSVDLGLKAGPPAAIPTQPKLVFSAEQPRPNG